MVASSKPPGISAYSHPHRANAAFVGFARGLGAFGADRQGIGGAAQAGLVLE
jgi:hypothetical protein